MQEARLRTKSTLSAQKALQVPKNKWGSFWKEWKRLVSFQVKGHWFDLHANQWFLLQKSKHNNIALVAKPAFLSEAFSPLFEGLRCFLWLVRSLDLSLLRLSVSSMTAISRSSSRRFCRASSWRWWESTGLLKGNKYTPRLNNAPRLSLTQFFSVDF